ncbi:MAG TPA: efflux RND transporter periplasmic adaptor subunit [Dongiaceae bacterium]|nr:efflux RND transporter periplasmic adaptor subunit [Dongiaceae bacterium]
MSSVPPPFRTSAATAASWPHRRRVVTRAGCLVLALGALLTGCSRHAAASDDEDSSADTTGPTVVAVQTGKLQPATLHRYATGYGSVAPAPATVDQPAAGVQLAPATAGVIAKVNIVAGQQVKSGDVLMELNSSALTLENAEQELARQKKLYAEQNTSLRNLQAAEAQLSLLRVVAPVSGTVASLNAKPGQAVDGTTIVAEIMDLNRLTVNAELPANTPDLTLGAEVQVQTDPPVTTKLEFISPTVNPTNDTVLVRAPLPAGCGLRPGQFVPLRIVTAVHPNCLAAPAASVVTDESGRSVVVLVHGDETSQTQVQPGLSENGLTEISAPGLKPGDVVVTVGAYGLPDKTKISVANP